jgi:phosphatidylinositol 3-kinase
MAAAPEPDAATADTLSFAPSSALDLPVRIRIIDLEGDEAQWPASVLLANPALRHVGSNGSPLSDIFITVQVFAGSKPLAVPVQTSYRAFKQERRWSEWLTLPITYALLPLNACLAITAWDLSPAGGRGARGHVVPFGGTTLPLFDRANVLVKGHQKCVVHRLREGDGSERTTTPASGDGIGDGGRRASEDPVVAEMAAELARMEAMFKKHEMGEIPRVDWLDQLVFRGSEKRGLPEYRASLQRRLVMARGGDGTSAAAAKPTTTTPTAAPAPGDRPGPSSFVLNVELPRFDMPIVFSDHEYAPPRISPFQAVGPDAAHPTPLKPVPEVQLGPGIGAEVEGGASSPSSSSKDMFRVYDAEVGQRENPAETKHRRLFRSVHRHGIMDKDLKPNAKVRDELNVILSYSPTHVLSPEETDLVWKFRYHLARDKRALTKFVKSVNWADQSEARQAVVVIHQWTEIDVDDALELLGPSFDNHDVRAYAVRRLRKSDDDELLLYLLQLVQALKYEHIVQDPEAAATTHDSSLARFLIHRAVSNFTLGNYFYWYLMVECDDHPAAAAAAPQAAAAPLDTSAVYSKVAYDFMVELVKQPGGADYRKTLLRQAEMVAVLSRISAEVKTQSETIAKKTDRVKHFLADPKNELVVIDPPLPMPLDPAVEVTGVVPADTTVFKSSLCPIKVTFKTTTGRNYPIIFKVGDDLRQDQLVIQIITLMDQLLQKENLDLRLSPYKILATSTAAGASQFVPSASLSSIIAKHGANPALAFLKHHNPDASRPLGLRHEALDTYVKSCAGYCVITYILGVGDRHSDNLLLAPDGHFFHADFGYILGRDPKPFAPVMKLSQQMVDAMGGAQSEHYRQFKQYCHLAYAALRKQSNLILNLFSLMVDANIPDIRLEPDKAVLKVRDRFHLELNDEEALLHLDRVIEESLSAFGPVVIDKLHGWTQALRS